MHELLGVSTTVLQYAPIAGLEEVAQLLLKIWDAIKQVRVSVRAL